MFMEVNMKKKIIILSSAVLAVSLLTIGAVYFLNRPTAEDLQAASVMAKTYSMSEKDVLSLKKDIGNWEKTGKKIIENKYTLSTDKKNELYNMGYSINDMEKAQELALRNAKDPMQILQVKGVASPNSKSWDKVIKELDLKENSVAEEFGFSSEEVNKLKKLNLKDTDIVTLAIIHQSYKVDISDLIKQIKQGKSANDIMKQYQPISKGDNIQ